MKINLKKGVLCIKLNVNLKLELKFILILFNLKNFKVY